MGKQSTMVVGQEYGKIKVLNVDGSRSYIHCNNCGNEKWMKNSSIMIGYRKFVDGSRTFCGCGCGIGKFSKKLQELNPEEAAKKKEYNDNYIRPESNTVKTEQTSFNILPVQEDKPVDAFRRVRMTEPTPRQTATETFKKILSRKFVEEKLKEQKEKLRQEEEIRESKIVIETKFKKYKFMDLKVGEFFAFDLNLDDVYIKTSETFCLCLNDSKTICPAMIREVHKLVQSDKLKFKVE